MEELFIKAAGFIRETVLPNIKTIIIAAVIALFALIAARLLLAALWENILVAVIKISDKIQNKNNKEKE